MMTKFGLRIPKFVVPAQKAEGLMESFNGICLICFEIVFACFLYTLLLAAYGLGEQHMNIERSIVNEAIFFKNFIFAIIIRTFLIEKKLQNNLYSIYAYSLDGDFLKFGIIFDFFTL